MIIASKFRIKCNYKFLQLLFLLGSQALFFSTYGQTDDNLPLKRKSFSLSVVPGVGSNGWTLQ